MEIILISSRRLTLRKIQSRLKYAQRISGMNCLAVRLRSREDGRIPAAGAFSHTVATPVPHPHSPRAARGDSSGPPERPKRGLPRIYRPLFGRSSGPNALTGRGVHHMIGNGQRISGVPALNEKAPRCRLPGGKSRLDSKFWNPSYESKISVWYF